MSYPEFLAEVKARLNLILPGVGELFERDYRMMDSHFKERREEWFYLGMYDANLQKAPAKLADSLLNWSQCGSRKSFWPEFYHCVDRDRIAESLKAHLCGKFPEVFAELQHATTPLTEAEEILL